MESQSYWHKGYVQTLLTLILVAVLIGLVAYINYTFKLADGVYTGETTINVVGEGEVMALPDLGTFSFSVQSEGDDATAAQERATESVDAVIKFLTDEGVAEKDIKTTNYNLNPKYRYEERVCLGNSYCPPGERIADGFEVYQNVTVKVRDLDQAGDLIAGVGERGATNISNLNFTIDDESALESEARKAAIADAKAKAQVLADNLGMRLGKIVGFYEENGGRPIYGYGGDKMMEEALDSRAVMSAPAVLPTGENEVRSVVNITYELR